MDEEWLDGWMPFLINKFLKIFFATRGRFFLIISFCYCSYCIFSSKKGNNLLRFFLNFSKNKIKKIQVASFSVFPCTFSFMNLQFFVFLHLCSESLFVFAFLFVDPFIAFHTWFIIAVAWTYLCIFDLAILYDIIRPSSPSSLQSRCCHQHVKSDDFISNT